MIEYDPEDNISPESLETIEDMKHVENPTIQDIREIVSKHSARVFKWGDTDVLVDAFTAQALIVVYDNLSPAMQEKFNRMASASYNQFLKLVDFTWKHVSYGD